MRYLSTIHLCAQKLLLTLAFNLLIGFSVSVQAQTENVLIKKIDDYNKSMPFEKLFLHTDKPYYAITDTIWFKAYLFNGLNNTYSPLSGLLYVELISGTKIVKRISVPVKIGLSWGQLPLDENAIEAGEYTLRAYTNWMQNFGEESFFTKHIYITNARSPGWLITQKQSINIVNGKQTASIDFHLKQSNNQAYSSKKVNWTVQDGENIVARGGTETTFDGQFKADFNLPEKPKGQLNILIEDKDLTKKAVIPVLVNRPANIDLQFMPEGGYLVTGIRTKVGFKAIAENGQGIDIEGKIVDSKNNNIMPFKSAYKGMGIFNFVPIAGETYTAKVALADGTIKSFNLPQIKNSGINLRIIDIMQRDSINVSINFSPDLLTGGQYQFMGLVNNMIYGQASFTASKPRVNITLPKTTFPSGIVHFAIFNNMGQPVSERAAYINNNDNLNITVTASKNAYKTRDSIALNIAIKDKDKNPVPAASLSISVTDNNQVKLDSMENNVITDILLTSGLKGNIETPAYYFGQEKNAADNLDILLLTQGWVGYNWDNIFKPLVPPLFKPEPEFRLSGIVTDYTDKPLPGSKVMMIMGGKAGMLADTITDAEGKFMFKQFPKFDLASFFVQAQNAKGKKSKMAIAINEFRPAMVSVKNTILTEPWYVNTDTTVLKFVNNDIAVNKQKISLTGNNMLNEVVVSGKKGIMYSKNLNGRGEADQVIDEAQIASAGEVPLLDFITKNVKGLYLKVTKQGDHQFAIKGGRKVNFVVDGLDIRRLFYTSDTSAIPNVSYDDLVAELNYLKIKDVIGVEIFYNPKYTDAYNNRLNNDATIVDNDAYIEITTRSGNGLIVKNRQNIASYKPIPITWPIDFYRPRYTSSNITSGNLDMRSTIFWQPHLPMANTGDASTSFFAADKPGIYTVIIQGSNLKGSVGYKRLQINIK